MNGNDYRSIRDALIYAKILIEDEIINGDPYGTFREQLDKNKLALEALKRNR